MSDSLSHNDVSGSPGNTSSASSSNDSPMRLKRVWRVAGIVMLLGVLALGFAGHLSADMQLQWENLMALCGF